MPSREADYFERNRFSEDEYYPIVSVVFRVLNYYGNNLPPNIGTTFAFSNHPQLALPPQHWDQSRI
jgi:hypothetical protein